MYIQLIVSTAKEAAQDVANNCLALRTRRLGRQVTRLYEEALRDVPVTAPQMTLLVAIVLEGPVPASKLGAALELEKSTLSRNLDRMIEQGWISAARDGRARVLSATAVGRRMMQRIHPRWVDAQRAAVEAMGREMIAELDRISDQLRSTK